MSNVEIFALCGIGICFAGSVAVNLYTLVLIGRCHELIHNFNAWISLQHIETRERHDAE